MLKQIEFKNFRVIRDAILPLSQVTVIVGPNGGGKSTVLQSLELLRGGGLSYDQAASIDRRDSGEAVFLKYLWNVDGVEANTILTWSKHSTNVTRSDPSHKAIRAQVDKITTGVRVFFLDPMAVAAPVDLVPKMELRRSGEGLAGVLDSLRDSWPERFEALNGELARWLPEFDRITFHVPAQGMRGFGLRRKGDGKTLLANDLSGGTLFAVALLTLAHLPSPPPIIGLEEPDHGMHPRLLRRVQDAIYRLAHPKENGEERPSTQVILTTHSPHFLDLFKDHPEEVIVANKDDQGVTFQRLADRPRMDEILPEGPLGDLWYSGLLGGVPAEPVRP